ncbi:flagellar hook-length control protein FliK [uncultured Pluralibacter sp.]|uniref:flagellar hook-length control protein FliK n=1 Tax=uncultured Pluralibacter sp. TaxID=1490864 RepID=UPI00261913F5|nr:flagellar hook-length control protein FliK [uncultured Pluralibacter sp.]
MMPLPGLRAASGPDALPRAGAASATDAADFAGLLGDALAPDAAARPAARGLPKGKSPAENAALKPAPEAAEPPSGEAERTKDASLHALLAMLPGGAAPVGTAGSHLKGAPDDDEKASGDDAPAVVTDPDALLPMPFPPAAASGAALRSEAEASRGAAEEVATARGAAQGPGANPVNRDTADKPLPADAPQQGLLPDGKDLPQPPAGRDARSARLPQPAPATADGAISFTTPPPPGSASATTSAAPTADINARLGTPEWQQSVSQHITLFTRQGQQRAELTLHPQDLGQITISMKLDDNQAQLQMLAGHGHVRAALEAALPQLRTSLADSGIQLAQSFIGSDASPGQQQADRQPPPALPHPEGRPQAADNKGSAAAPASLLARARGDGAVDTFA